MNPHTHKHVGRCPSALWGCEWCCCRNYPPTPIPTHWHIATPEHPRGRVRLGVLENNFTAFPVAQKPVRRPHPLRHKRNPRICAHASQCNGIRDRSKSVELWSGVAQYCLLVGNYNSATAILESLESPAIARLQTTVSYPRTHDYWASTPPHTLYQIGPFVGESFGAGGCLHYSLSRIPCKRVCMLICIHIVFLGVYACT